MKKRVIIIVDIDMYTDSEQEVLDRTRKEFIAESPDRSVYIGWKVIGFVFPRLDFHEDGPNKPNVGNIGWRGPEW